jgi:hypothetical protein
MLVMGSVESKDPKLKWHKGNMFNHEILEPHENGTESCLPFVGFVYLVIK